MDDRAGWIFDYDVCLSFAAEDRQYVRRVASRLQDKGVKVFFDEYELVELWGKDLYTHLDHIYRRAARYCVLFASQHYARRVWPNHERRSAQARALVENQEYLLPARFDDTEIPGLPPTVGYVDLRGLTSVRFSTLLLKKIRSGVVAEVPSEPDRLFDRLGVVDPDEKMIVLHRAQSFLAALRRMSIEERKVVTAVFSRGCPEELPDNVHQSLDLLRRILGVPAKRVLEVLSGLRSLGFAYEVRHDTGEDVLVLTWDDYHVDTGGEGTAVAYVMIELAAGDFCEEHGREVLDRLDFSRLASKSGATAD